MEWNGTEKEMKWMFMPSDGIECIDYNRDNSIHAVS